MAKRSRVLLDIDEEDGDSNIYPERAFLDSSSPESTTQEDLYGLGTELSESQNQLRVNDYLFQSMPPREREVAISYGIKLCKAAMAAELKNQVITKGYITKYVLGDERGLKFAHIYRYAQLSLLKLGFELVPLPTKDNKETDVKKLGQSLNTSYIVRSTLPTRLHQIVGDYFLKQANDDWETPNAYGPITLVVCTLLLHKNTMSRNELVEITRKFGISDLLYDELIKRALREEYILEERVVNGDTNSKNKANKRRRAGISNRNDDDAFVQYHLGRRAFVEFPKKNVVLFLKELYSVDRFDEQKAEISLSWW